MCKLRVVVTEVSRGESECKVLSVPSMMRNDEGVVCVVFLLH